MAASVPLLRGMVGEPLGSGFRLGEEVGGAVVVANTGGRVPGRAHQDPVQGQVARIWGLRGEVELTGRAQGQLLGSVVDPGSAARRTKQTLCLREDQGVVRVLSGPHRPVGRDPFQATGLQLDQRAAGQVVRLRHHARRYRVGRVAVGGFGGGDQLGQPCGQFHIAAGPEVCSCRRQHRLQRGGRHRLGGGGGVVEQDSFETAGQEGGGIDSHAIGGPAVRGSDHRAGQSRREQERTSSHRTCAVPAIPWSWIAQVRPGGVVLADLKLAPGAGSLIRLTRTAEERAEGRFDATYAAFMDLSRTPGVTRAGFHVKRDRDGAEHRTTSPDPNTPWTSLLVWFLASFELGPEIAYGYILSDTTPTVSWIATPDGSWAEISLTTRNGRHEVAEGGPRRLWRLVEKAHRTWVDLGRPGWDRFGLTVTPRTHTCWFDHPDNELRADRAGAAC